MLVTLKLEDGKNLLVGFEQPFGHASKANFGESGSRLEVRLRGENQRSDN